jgi:hypothetical protein
LKPAAAESRTSTGSSHDPEGYPAEALKQSSDEILIMSSFTVFGEGTGGENRVPEGQVSTTPSQLA